MLWERVAPSPSRGLSLVLKNCLTNNSCRTFHFQFISHFRWVIQRIEIDVGVEWGSGVANTQIPLLIVKYFNGCSHTFPCFVTGTTAIPVWLGGRVVKKYRCSNPGLACTLFSWNCFLNRSGGLCTSVDFIIINLWRKENILITACHRILQRLWHIRRRRVAGKTFPSKNIFIF